MKQKGMTIFEMMIALLVIGILSGYAIPNYRNLKMNQAMTQSINQLVAGINYARNQSIIRTEQIVVCPSAALLSCSADSDWHNGWMVFIDQNKDRQFNGADEIIASESRMTATLEATSSAYRKLIRYDNMGASPGTNITISFCDERGSEHAKAVIINNIGRPRVSETAQCS